MAKAKTVTVQLAEYLADQGGEALKELVSAPIAYRLERLIRLAKTERMLGDVGATELISAILHGTKADGRSLAKIVKDYRNAQVWETRHALGERTATTGRWEIRLRGPGERWG